MLMKSKFDSYCSRCGKPIFEGDLIEYDTDMQRAFCISCMGKREKIIDCKHRAVTRYDGSYSTGTPRCLICGKETFIDKNKNMYIQITTKKGRGHSRSYGVSVDSYINYVKDEKDHPDLESLNDLYKIIADKNIDNKIKKYAKNHIKRICSSLNIQNQIDLYNEESFNPKVAIEDNTKFKEVKNGCDVSYHLILGSPVFYSLKEIDERQKLKPLFSNEVTDSIFNDLLNLHEHVYGDFTFEEIMIGYYITGKICDTYIPFGLFLALIISSKNYIKYENLESKSLEFKIHSFNNHITNSYDFLKYFNSVDIDSKLALYINYLAIKSNNIDAYISQKCIENCINFNKFNIMDKYIEESINYYKFDNEYKRFCSREDFLEFKELIDLFEMEFIKRQLNFNKVDIDDDLYMIEYAVRITINLNMIWNGIIFDTISVCSFYDKKYNLCNKKIIRTWQINDFYEWFGYSGNQVICGFGNGEIHIHDIKRYLSILNNNIISKIKTYF